VRGHYQHDQPALRSTTQDRRRQLVGDSLTLPVFSRIHRLRRPLSSCRLRRSPPPVPRPQYPRLRYPAETTSQHSGCRRTTSGVHVPCRRQKCRRTVRQVGMAGHRKCLSTSVTSARYQISTCSWKRSTGGVQLSTSNILYVKS